RRGCISVRWNRWTPGRTWCFRRRRWPRTPSRTGCGLLTWCCREAVGAGGGGSGGGVAANESVAGATAAGGGAEFGLGVCDPGGAGRDGQRGRGRGRGHGVGAGSGERGELGAVDWDGGAGGLGY